MAVYKFLAICLILISAKSAFGKPFDDNSNFFDSEEEEIRKNPTPSQKLLIFAFDNFISMSKNFATNAANVSRHMLQDESLMANNKTEVVEFKNKLTKFVNEYEITKSPLSVWDILDLYTNTTDQYTDSSEEDNATADSKYIKSILQKYNSEDVSKQFAKEFMSFIENFEKLFAENKTHLGKHMLDWYENYNTLEDIDDKIDAIGNFMKFA